MKKIKIIVVVLMILSIGYILLNQKDTVPALENAEEITKDIENTSSTDDRATAIMSANWANSVEISIDGNVASFTSDGLPDHEILDQYLGDGPDGKFIVENSPSAYDASFTFPVEPIMLDKSAQTPNGAIGVSVSGAVFFNPFEGDGSGIVANDDNALIDGIPFIDACGGHPLPNSTTYHYHGIPFCITDAQDTAGQHSEIIGFLFDGIPIYGPQDTDGTAPTDLDECLGHTGTAPGYTDDIYHYHVTEDANYISECYAGEATSARPGAQNENRRP